MGNGVFEEEIEALWKDIKGIPCPFRGIGAKFIRKKEEIFNGRLTERRRNKGDACALMFAKNSPSCSVENGEAPCLEACGRFNTTAGRRTVAMIMTKFFVSSYKLKNKGRKVPAMEWLLYITNRENH